MIGTIEYEDIPDQDDGTYKVVQELSDDEWELMKSIPGGEEAAKDMGIDGPGTYVATIEIKDGIVTDTSDWEKVPTMAGILGLVIMIVGIILLIVGLVTGRAAPVAPAQPPMEQPPYQEPPMQQPPYQQPPPQQPPMPPPPPR